MRLSARDSRDYWRTLMANVVALIGDAHVLLDHGSPGRARSLLILAQEELARATVLYDAAVPAWEGRAKTVELPQRPHPTKPDRTLPHLTASKNHQEKIAVADIYGHNLKPFWGDYSDWVESETGPASRDSANIDREKQAGFYVDTKLTGGRFASPLDVAREPVVAELERVAGVAEMALIADHTRMQALGTAESDDSAQHLHMMVLAYAHPDLWTEA